MVTAKRMFVVLAFASVAFYAGTKAKSAPNPDNAAPSYLKINSVTVKGSAKTPGTHAPAGEALVATGNSTSEWANVQGVAVASDVSIGGSPASANTLLTADGSGKASWQPIAPFPKVKVSAAGVTYTGSVNKTINFDTEIFNSGNMHSGTRLVCTSAGTYAITAQVNIETEAGANSGIPWNTSIVLNGASTVAANNGSFVSSFGYPIDVPITTIQQLQVGDYVEVQVYIGINGGTYGGGTSYFMMNKLP